MSGALKLWFRELPEPLLTFGLYDAFIEAARTFIFGHTHSLLTVTGYDNDRLRYIRLHGQVNNLPDPNYATLKFFMGHLNRYVDGGLLECPANHQNPTARIEELNVNLQPVYRIRPHAAGRTSRDGRIKLGAHELSVQGMFSLPQISL